MPLYPFDSTGLLPGNKIINELRSVVQFTGSANVGYLIVPNAAPFYKDSFSIRFNSTDPQNSGFELVPGIHFEYAHPWQQAMDWIGKEVYGAIVLTDPAFAGDLVYSYQTIGGTYVDNKPVTIVEGLVALDAAILVDWSTAPAEFPPTPHSHPLSGMTGMSQIYEKLDQIATALRSPERKIALDDVVDLETEFMAPFMQTMSEMQVEIANTGAFAPSLNDLILKVGRLHPVDSIDDTHSTFATVLGGFFHVRVGYIDFPPLSAPSTLSWATFPSKCLYVNTNVTIAPPGGLTDANIQSHVVRHTSPTKTGLSNVIVDLPDLITGDTRRRRLHYLAIGI